MQRSKVETFIGFSIRAKKLIAGANAIRESKGLYLMFVCNTASENSQKDALKIARSKEIPLVLVKNGTAEDLVLRANCKMFAIADKDLAKAIESNLDENFEVIFNK
ncbi:MAG: hypothetical protein IKA18_01535 [Clostridia bacterium]|nr:hypothetical protein [Clostridia bacterium]